METNLAEILFDNSEEIPNDKYVIFMNMLKRYHEFKDNERELRKYLKNFDKDIREKLEAELPKRESCCNKALWCSISFGISIIFVGSICYFYLNSASH